MASRGVIDKIGDAAFAVLCLGFYANFTPFAEGVLKDWIRGSEEILEYCNGGVKSATGEHVAEHVPEDVAAVKK